MKKALSILLSIIMVMALLPINYLASTVTDNYASIVTAAYNLHAGKYLNGGYSYTLAGEIISIDTPYSQQYGNVTVTIVVAGMTDKPVQLFRLKGDGADKLEVGNTVIAKGPICKYAFKDDEGNVTSTNVQMEQPTLIAHNGTGVDTEDTIPEFEAITTPETGRAYKFFMAQNDIGKLLYLKGTTQNNAGKFIETTTKAIEAVDVYVEPDAEGYKFYTIIDYVKKYLLAKTESSFLDDGSERIMKFLNWEENGSVFYYNTTANAWFTTISGKEYVIGTYGIYETASLSDASYITAENTGKTQFPIQLVDKAAAEQAAEVKPETPETPTITDGTVWTYDDSVKAWYATFNNEKYFFGSYSTFTTLSLAGYGTYLTPETTGVTQFPAVLVTSGSTTSVSAPVANTAYRIYFDQKTAGKKVYALGTATNDQNKYISTTETASQAVDVYAEAATGGYKFYILDGSNKKYLTAKVENSSKYIYWAGTTTTPETPDTPDTPDTPVTPPATQDPAADSTLTITEAIALGTSKAYNTYTDVKYYVIGTITEVNNTTYGNMHITDDNGSTLYIYGSYNEDGSVRYDGLTTKPVAGDKIKVYGIIGQYNDTPQMKNGWIVEFGDAVCEHSYDNECDADCNACGEIRIAPHNFGEWEVIREANCSNAGEKQRVCLNDATHVQTDVIDIIADAHNFGEWEVIREANCSDAGEKQRVCLNDATHVQTDVIGIIADAHNFGEWKVSKPGTCTDAAIEYRVCLNNSNHTETREGEIDLHNHNFSDWVENLPGNCINPSIEARICFNDIEHSETREGSIVPDSHTYDSVCDDECNLCQQKRKPPHAYSEEGICTNCNRQQYVLGDLNDDGIVNDKDAKYLLFHTFLPEKYPINANCDYNKDGIINDRDAIYLLYYSFNSETYPID